MYTTIIIVPVMLLVLQAVHGWFEFQKRSVTAVLVLLAYLNQINNLANHLKRCRVGMLHVSALELWILKILWCAIHLDIGTLPAVAVKNRVIYSNWRKVKESSFWWLHKSRLKYKCLLHDVLLLGNKQHLQCTMSTCVTTYK